MRLKGYFLGIFFATAIAAFLITTLRPDKLLAHIALPNVHLSRDPRLAGVTTPASVRRMGCNAGGNCTSPLSLPVTLEANEGQADPRVKFIARGQGITGLLTAEGIEVVVGSQQKGMVSRVVKLRFEAHGSEAEQIAQSGESSTKKPRPSAHTSSATQSETHSRRKRRSGSASGAPRHRRARKKSARPRSRRKRAAGDSSPTQRHVPHQTAPEIPTAPREKNPPNAEAGDMQWRGDGKLTSETNYFEGNDPYKWRTHVGHFSRAVARDVLPGVDVVAYGNERALEYDLRVGPEVDARSLRLQISGADDMKVDADGDLVILFAGQEIRMKKPAMYEEINSDRSPKSDSGDAKPQRRAVAGGYAIETDGTVGFQIEARNTFARMNAANPSSLGTRNLDAPGTLVIDPSLSVSYSTFLGGAGNDSATSIVADSSGKIYVSGTTTSAATFSETSKKFGTGGGTSDYFIAKIDPTQSGLNSLVYLTFIGGSGDEEGGFLAVDANGNAAIAGTTTSTDFPVTDGSTRTAGANDATITEINPAGTQLVFSTLFGGSGAEATQGPGGIALDSSGNVFVAMDTNSTDLPTTAGAFQTAYGGGTSDGFLAIFQPATVPTLKYCTYLGLDAQASVAGVAVDSAGNAYLAGFTSNPGGTLITTNGFQTTYGGDPFDGFVMEIMPAGNGSADLAYATFLGGGSSDKALAIAVGTNLPATAYVTGSTQSSNFPTSGSVAALQTSLKGTANAFLSVISQNPTTGLTSLAYSSYLGGSETDTGQGVFFAAANQIYLAGTTMSWDFPRRDNFQPFNGDAAAFVTMLDPTSAGVASLLYSTPLGGTAPVGVKAGSSGNAIAADATGNVYVAGATLTADFPRAGSPMNGMQPTCASCQLAPPQNDVFVVKIVPSTAMNPSVSFSAANLNFGSQPVGVANTAQLPVAVINTGDAPLSFSSIAITGPNSSDFSAVNTAPCLTSPIVSGSTCAFEMEFAPSVVGVEGAFLSFTGNAPGSPQVLALLGTGAGPLAVPSPLSINFGSVPVGTSPSQSIKLTNMGNQTLQITNIAVAGNNIAQFPVSADTCSANLAADVSCGFSISFTPSSPGAFSAAVNVTDNSGNLSGAVQTIPLTGNATPAAPILNVSPTALVFASQAVGSTSGNQTVTLSNQGSAALNISSIALVGGGASSFAIIPLGSSPCPSNGTVAAAATCTVTVNFTPSTTGTKNASLSLSDNATGSPQTVSLTGTAVGPTIVLSASSLNFGSQPAGTTSSAQTVTVSNNGATSLGISGIVLVGTNPSDFIETNNCPQSLGASASCLITVKFDPAASGPENRAASISVSDNAPQSPQTISLTGTATVATVTVSPSTLSFGSQLVGATPSSPVAVTVTNTGQGALTVSGVTVSDTTDFTLTNNCTRAVPGAGTCTVQITFSPAAPASGAQCGSTSGTKTTTLTLTDNATNSPQTVALNGTATDFCPNPPTVGGNNLTVTQGTTAVFHLAINSTDGFAGTVALSCAGAVPGAGSCTTSTSTVAVPANGQAPFMVSVPTASELVRPKAREFRTPPWSWYVLMAGLIAILGLSSLGHRLVRDSALGRWDQNSGSVSDFCGKRRMIRIVPACALLFILLFAMSACGGGGSSATQANTYSFTVTATSGGATRTITLTLTVQ
jgi:centrosomal CEP192-like protein